MKTAHYEIKIAEQKQARATLIELLSISELNYNMVEFESGCKLLANTLKPHSNRLKIYRAIISDPEKGFWNWWINFRQQQEQDWFRYIVSRGFENMLDDDAHKATAWLKRNWERIHNEMEVSEIAIISCGNFIKNKLK
jgi:hypothetical protein